MAKVCVESAHAAKQACRTLIVLADLAGDAIGKLGSGYVQGIGHQLVESVGGVLEHMDGYFVTAPFYPPENLLKAILVDKQGKRFIAANSYHSRSTAAALAQPGRAAYLICESAIYDRCEHPHMLIDGWETVEDMEAGLSLPEGALAAMIAAYNEAAAQGEAPAFRKHPKWLKPLDQPPFAAIDCSLGSPTFLGFTLGGLRTSVRGAVLDAQDRPMARLYAAGACASNLACDSMGYSTGTCIGESTCFGRQGGMSAAADGQGFPKP